MPPGVLVHFPINLRRKYSRAHSRRRNSAIFEAFGPLRHCNLCPDAKLLHQHRGYGYVEYEVVADAINAMNSLHNFELAGRQLKIGKTVVGGPIALGMKDAAALKKKKSATRHNRSSFRCVVLNQIKLPSAVLKAAQQINAALGSNSSNSDGIKAQRH